MADNQPFHGAGDSDKCQAAFFFNIIFFGLIANGPFMGKNSLFQAGHDHHGKFQTFGRMERHHGNGAAIRLHTIGIGYQRDLGQIVQQRAAGVLPVKFGGNIDQFLNVGCTLQRFFIRCFKVQKAGTANQFFNNRGYGHYRGRCT